MYPLRFPSVKCTCGRFLRDSIETGSHIEEFLVNRTFAQPVKGSVHVGQQRIDILLRALHGRETSKKHYLDLTTNESQRIKSGRWLSFSNTLLEVLSLLPRMTTEERAPWTSRSWAGAGTRNGRAANRVMSRHSAIS
jgi:hypothetical protein